MHEASYASTTRLGHMHMWCLRIDMMREVGLRAVGCAVVARMLVRLRLRPCGRSTQVASILAFVNEEVPPEVWCLDELIATSDTRLAKARDMAKRMRARGVIDGGRVAVELVAASASVAQS